MDKIELREAYAKALSEISVLENKILLSERNLVKQKVPTEFTGAVNEWFKIETNGSKVFTKLCEKLREQIDFNYSLKEELQGHRALLEEIRKKKLSKKSTEIIVKIIEDLEIPISIKNEPEGSK